MKAWFIRANCFAVCWILLTSSGRGQQAVSGIQNGESPSTQTIEPHGKILFSRSSDSGQSPAALQTQAASTLPDADRLAITFTRYGLEIHLRPRDHAIDVRAQLTVRNDSDHPLQQLPLQLSSTLDWQAIRTFPEGNAEGSNAKFAQATIASDVDHTGQLHEADIELPQPLAPSASLKLEVFYGGTISQDAKRLIQIGTPPEMAQASDWDEISAAFTGLRGFGNVVWYPVSSVPVRLGDGDKLFAEAGAAKQREQTALVSMSVTIESSPDDALSAPNIAILNGTVVPVSVTSGTSAPQVPIISKAELPMSPLRFQTLSLFVTHRDKRSGNALEVYYRAEDEPNVQAYLAAGSMVTPLLRSWLQPTSENHPRALLSVLDLADANDAPFEERQTLFTPLAPFTADQLTSPMSHALSHGYFQSPRPWLNEGVAHFMASLWTEQTHDRETALTQLDNQRAALALAEPGEQPGDQQGSRAAESSPGLISNPNAIFYRTKATYVLWMLRSMIGDEALQNALKLYDPAQDTKDNYFEQLVTRTSVAQPVNKDLHQFFEDWVYNDRGLPDLAISGAYTNGSSAPGTFLIAVDVSNSGAASANVPIIVSSANTQVTERLLVPAHGHGVRRILIQGEPTQVQVNDGTVPETTASVHVEQIHYSAPATP